MMAAFGLAFCACLAIAQNQPLRARIHGWRKSNPQARGAVLPSLAAVPLGWLLKPPPPGWVDAMSTRHCFWLYQWTWYEWLGAIAPLMLFGLLMRWTRQRGERPLACFASAVLAWGIFQQATAVILCGPRRLVVLATLEPMRYLQLVYIFLVLIGGALLGRHILKARAARWIACLLLLSVPMFLVQRKLFASTPHIELPGLPTRNPWLQAFDWIRLNTSSSAYFAAGPQYLTEPAEDMHSFRALAERSVLADDLKDRSIISKAPELVPEWRRQVDAQREWGNLDLAGFKRLRTDFGVDWVLLDQPPPDGLPCPWRKGPVSVCSIPSARGRPKTP
jgi:hypothetical protein